MNGYEHRQLLCTFADRKDFHQIVESINSFYNVYNKRIFVFSNNINPKELYLTYNVVNITNNGQKFPNTILIHRKKQTNTLYTLNAMNKLIEEENGQVDKSFVVNWKLYENSLIIAGDVSVRIIPLKIFEVLISNKITSKII